MNPKAEKNFFLISFLPALAYWYLEANYSLKIALIGGILLAILEITAEKLIIKHVHTISKFNFFLIVILGGFALLGEDGIWFKLQPMFTGLGVGLFLLYRRYKKNSLMLEMMKSFGNDQAPPEEIIIGLEFHMSLFFLCYGLFMGGVALYGTTSNWLFFKTAGFYICFVVLFIFEFLWMRSKMKKIAQRELKKQLLNSVRPK